MVRTLLVMFGAFVGTMIDNFFAFAAQLGITSRDAHRRLAITQWLGVVTLVAASLAIGTVLAIFPLHVVAVLALAPLALAVHAWRNPGSTEQPTARGIVTTFAVTVALGGDNVAVWTPLLRSDAGVHRLVAVVTLLALDALMVAGAHVLAGHPTAVALGKRVSGRLLPFLYVLLTVVILAECGWW